MPLTSTFTTDPSLYGVIKTNPKFMIKILKSLYRRGIAWCNTPSRRFNVAKMMLVAIMAACASEMFAAGNGLAGINEATSLVTGYFDPGTKLIYAIGAVVGLIGGVKVYSKWSSGDPDTTKTAASWFGACIFLIVAATILRSFFL